LQCAQNDCLSEAAPCIQDNTCQGWVQCVSGCAGDDTCLGNCDSMFASASVIYEPIYTCTCQSCQGECGGVIDPCNPHGGGTGGAAGTGGAGGAAGTGGASGTGGAGGQ
ncbi:MAG TPA: hypothetical protein VGM56_13575, partial [Byssovorax sp.]